MFERVLVAYDGSPAAEAGLSFARRLSRACGSKVTVAHVVEPDRRAEEASGPPAGPDAARTWLEGVCSEGADPRSPALTPVVLEEGKPAAAIIELAERGGADLIVVGKSGRHSLGRFLLGSAAERIVRHSPCSVAVFPPKGAEVASPPRVLAGYDGSDRSKEAVRRASTLAAALSVGLLVVHVLDYRVPFASSPPESARELMRERAAALLREGCSDLSAPLESVQSELRSGDPRAGLVEAAREHRPLLLVVGSRGLGGFPGLILGSTADEAVRAAECPVLVVKDGS